MSRIPKKIQRQLALALAVLLLATNIPESVGAAAAQEGAQALTTVTGDDGQTVSGTDGTSQGTEDGTAAEAGNGSAAGAENGETAGSGSSSTVTAGNGVALFADDAQTVSGPDQSFAFEDSTGSFEKLITEREFSNPASSINASSATSVPAVTYESSDAEVATVDEDGLVTFVKAGAVTITAKQEAYEVVSGGDSIPYEETEISYELTINKAEQSLVGGNTEAQKVYYGQDYTFTAEPVENTDAPDGIGHGTGDITYTVTEGAEIASIDAGTGVVTFADQKTGTVKLRAEIAEDEDYQSAYTELELSVVYADSPAQAYTLSGAQKLENSVWYTGEVTLTPAVGYLVSTSGSREATNDWKAELQYSEERLYSEEKIYLKEEATGAITDAIAVAEFGMDQKAPTDVEITYSESVINKVISNITFGFFKNSVEVTLSAQDVTSGVDYFTYYLDENDAGTKVQATASQTGGYTATFKIEKAYKGNISATATDKAGNCSEEKKDTEYTIVIDNAEAQLSVKYSNTPTAAALTAPLEKLPDYVPGTGSDYYLYYKNPVTLTFTIKAEYFFTEYVEALVNGQTTELTWTDGTEADTHTAQLVLDSEGEYVVELSYNDVTGNGKVSYKSEHILIDATAPTVQIAYDNNTPHAGSYYDKGRTATITVTDVAVNPGSEGDVSLTLEATDLLGQPVSFDTALDWKQSAENADVWTATLAFADDAVYSFELAVTDMAGNTGKSEVQQFTVDQTAPTDVEITYETPLAERVKEGITFGFYKAALEVTLSAKDATSGVESFTYYLSEDDNGTTVSAVDSGSGIYTCSFMIRPQYKGVIFAEATDRAGNCSSKQEDDRTVVIDSEKAQLSVTYSEVPTAAAAADNRLEKLDSYETGTSSDIYLYYKNAMTLTFAVTEANFDEQDAKVLVNGNEKTLTWEATTEADTYSAQLSLDSEGEYVVAVSYEDASQNGEVSYQSEHIVIDLTAPTVQIAYDNNTPYAGSYYDKGRTATITVTDVAVNPGSEGDVSLTLEATDLLGQPVSFDTALDWKQSAENADVWTATLAFADDAVYSFELAVTDMAGNTGKSEAQQFTVDQTAPTDVEITYEKPLKEKVKEGITFGFYKAALEVTLSAKDATSGVESFTYYLSEEDNGTTVSANDAGSGVSTYSFTIRPQYKGVIFAEATDRAGNCSSKQEDDRTVVIDSEKAQLSVTYSEVPTAAAAADNRLEKLDSYETGTSSDIYLYYKNAMTLTFAVTEANFDEQDAKVLVNGNEKTLTWEATTEADTYSAQLSLDSEGEYVVAVSYEDASQNGVVEYQSEHIVIDLTAPDVDIVYDNNAPYTGSYYNQGRTATITVTDRQINPTVSGNANLTVEAKDPLGQPVPFDGTLDWKQSAQNADVWTTTLAFTDDAAYSVSLAVTDMAGNGSGTDTEEFSVDTEKPEALSITYGESNRWWQGILQTITFGFYNPSVDVTLKAQDTASPIEKMELFSQKTADAAGKLQMTIDNTKITNEKTASGSWEATATVTLTATEANQLQDFLSMQATDAAGNVSTRLTDTGTKIVVDTIAPTLELVYSQAKRESGNTLYYDAAATLTFRISETNFYPEDVVISVFRDGSELTAGQDYNYQPGNWSTTDGLHQLALVLGDANTAGSKDGVYTVTVSYTDRSGNKMTGKSGEQLTNASYTSKQIVVDTVRPVVKTTYPASVQTTGGVSYYKNAVTMQVTVQDKNFNASDMSATVTARDANSADVTRADGKKVSDYLTAYLKDGTAWTALGNDTYQATLNLQEEAVYSFSVAYADMAGNAAVYGAGSTGTYGTDRLVVDRTAPVRVEPARYADAYSTSNLVQIINADRATIASDSAGATSEFIYSGEAALSVTIREANFQSANVSVKVSRNGTVVNPGDGYSYNAAADWKTGADKNLHSLELRLGTGNANSSKDGTYKVEISYKDPSGNEMAVYTSSVINIDTAGPQLSVNYSDSGYVTELDGIRYYSENRTATISVTERNFRPAEIKVEVVATDAAGSAVGIENYEETLHQPGSWTRDGDVNTATITFSAEANYTFNISYTDLANHQASERSADKFTVDKTAPEGLSISYSTPVLETVLQAVTFGFYRAQVTVTMSATDATSGVSHFDYSYIKSQGVSNVNAELLNARISEQSISYSDGRKVATATFQIPGTELRGDTQFNGTVEFTAADRTEFNTKLTDTKRIVVDSIAPTAEVRYNDPVQQANGISYYAGNIEATIAVTEANFYAEDVEVSVSRDGGAAERVTVSWTDETVDRHVGRFTLSQDGDYVVSISYTDRSTNEMTQYQSEQMTIDTEQPQLRIEGIGNRSANRGDTIGFVLIAEDVNFDAAAFSPKLTAEVRGEDGTIREVDLTDAGNLTAVTVGRQYRYTVDNLEQDGIYTLTCALNDMAGNAISDIEVVKSGSEKTELVQFSVNRNGSTYSLDADTRALNGSFTKQAGDVGITEINADELSNIKVTVFKDDKTVALQEGTDYQIRQSGGGDTWYEYDYAIFAKNFADDAIYRVSVYSEDAAGNVAENTLDVKNMEISFGVDKTAPNLIVANLESGQTYPVERLDVLMQADDNMKLTSVEVQLDGARCASWNEDEIRQMKVASEDFGFAVTGDSTRAHEVVIKLLDAAGNETVQQISDFYVTTNKLVRFWNNKPLLFGTAAGAAAVAASPAVVIGIRRRRLRLKPRKAKS